MNFLSICNFNGTVVKYVGGITGKDIKTVKAAYERFVTEAVNAGVQLE